MAKGTISKPAGAIGSLVAVAVVIVGAYLFPWQGLDNALHRPTTLSLARYESIRLGMTREEAEGILGVQGVEYSTSQALDSTYKTMRYVDGNAVVAVTYADGVVTEKAQSGL